MTPVTTSACPVYLTYEEALRLREVMAYGFKAGPVMLSVKATEDQVANWRVRYEEIARWDAAIESAVDSAIRKFEERDAE